MRPSHCREWFKGDKFITSLKTTTDNNYVAQLRRSCNGMSTGGNGMCTSRDRLSSGNSCGDRL